MKRTLKYFSKGEITLWSCSAALIITAFCIFDRNNYLSLFASLIGAASLILSAKGNPVGQGLMIVFSILYGIISYTFAYYGEMITYLGMTAPMAVFALISWLRNPYNGKRSQVAVNHLQIKEVMFMAAASIVITAAFYFVLAAFDTANLLPSTLSVTTSFIAVYLTFRRSEYFALAYAANDVVLILLWTLATIDNTAYLSVVICFVTFLVNDLYGFINWRRMRKRQSNVPLSSNREYDASSE